MIQVNLEASWVARIGLIATRPRIKKNDSAIYKLTTKTKKILITRPTQNESQDPPLSRYIQPSKPVEKDRPE